MCHLVPNWKDQCKILERWSGASCPKYGRLTEYWSWVHTGWYTTQFVIMRKIITTNWLHRPVRTRYMHGPAVGNNVVPPAVHAAQSHDIVNTTMGLSCAAPEHHSRPRVHTASVVGHLPVSTQPWIHICSFSSRTQDWIQKKKDFHYTLPSSWMHSWLWPKKLNKKICMCESSLRVFHTGQCISVAAKWMRF